MRSDGDRLTGRGEHGACRRRCATSFGITHLPCCVLVGLVRDHALREQTVERLVDRRMPGRLCMARVKKRA